MCNILISFIIFYGLVRRNWEIKDNKKDILTLMTVEIGLDDKNAV